MVNMVQENSYLIWDDSREACIIDPGFMTDSNLKQLQQTIEQEHLTLTRCIGTHRHFDHYLGALKVKEQYGVVLEMPEEDIDLLPSIEDQMRLLYIPSISPLEEPETKPLQLEPDGSIHFGDTKLQVIKAPGHSPGHVCYYYAGGDGALFSGDVIFLNDHGRYDLWGGSYEALMDSIKNLLTILPASTVIYSGHGPNTTVGAERRNYQM